MREKTRDLLTRPRFGIHQQILPEIVITLLLRKINGPMYVSQSLNDEGQRLLIISHPAQQENHLRYKISFLTYFVCHF